jgi:DNA-binding MarR family transcriptional regulator
MGTILGNLEQKRLVAREPSALHQRVLSTRLTSAGKAVVLAADRAAKNVEQHLSAQFSADEGQQLKDLLDRAVAALQDHTSPHLSADPDPEPR